MEHKKIFKNTFFQAAARTITSLVTFITTLLIAWHFGVVGYGDFIKITTFVSLFYLIVDFGLNAVFLQKDNEGNINFRELFYLRFLISILLLISINIATLILPFNQALGVGFSPMVKMGIFIFSFSLLTQAITLSSSAIFQKRERYDLLLMATTIGSVITLVLVFVYIYLSYSLNFIISAFIVGGVVSSLLALKFSREKIFPFFLKLGLIKSLVIDSLPIGLMLVFNLIYFRIDILLLSLLKTTTDVGIYGISQRLFDFLIALPLFLSNALYPRFLQHKKKHRNTIGVMENYLLFSFLLSLILILIFWFLAPFIYLVKIEFIPAILPFRILLISLPLFFATSILQWFLISQRQQKFLMYVYLASGILNIVLNLIFIPTWSYIASAIITDVSEGIVLVCLVLRVFFRQNFHED